MKICFVAWSDFGIGGVPRVLTGLMNSLSREHDVSLYSLKNLPQSDAYVINREQIHIYCREMTLYEKIRRSAVDFLVNKTPLFSSSLGCRMYASARYTSSFKKALASHINEHQYDVVIFGSGLEDSLLLSLVRPHIPLHTKTVSWSHTSYEDYFRIKGNYFSRYFHHALRMFYHRFDQIVVLSNDDQKNFKIHDQLTTQRIYNPSSFKPKKYSSLTSKTFVFAGALSSHKGVDIALKAFEEFSKDNEEWNLHLYGDGPLRPWIEKFIWQHDLQSRVHLHGNQGNMEQEYPKHTIFLFPSRYEGFGLVQIEAMSCGLPIIAANLPICRELIKDSGAGHLFPAGDSHALCNIMHSMVDEDLTPYALKARAQEQFFTQERITGEWNNLLKSLNS